MIHFPTFTNMSLAPSLTNPSKRFHICETHELTPGKQAYALSIKFKLFTGSLREKLRASNTHGSSSSLAGSNHSATSTESIVGCPDSNQTKQLQSCCCICTHELVGLLPLPKLNTGRESLSGLEMPPAVRLGKIPWEFEKHMLWAESKVDVLGPGGGRRQSKDEDEGS